MDQQQQPGGAGQSGNLGNAPSGPPGPTGRRLHIAHRRTPSEMTPLVSMFQGNPQSMCYPFFKG